MHQFYLVVFALFVLLFLNSGCSSDTSRSLEVIDGEYKLPAAIDPSVTDAMETELWAHVWRPSTGGPYPLVVFLHGNHGTCGKFDSQLGIRIDDRLDYTTTGVCPDGYEVTPNHRGYDYLAKPLAGYGYVVVSINTNRGVNGAPGAPDDKGLNLRRGRLVLRHLEQLALWNAGAAAPQSLGFQLAGLINFSQIGLMGHSRGGEGMRAAIVQYHDPGSPWPGRIGSVTFRALFEIGPVDGQTSRTLNATNVVWNVLLPGCDGDVADLQGVKPFDRMLQDTGEAGLFPKSTFQVFGANHNFYNTQWQESDAQYCVGQTKLFPDTLGSPQQRETSFHTLIPFFLSNTGYYRQHKLARRFDPSQALPATLTSVTNYARGYTPTPHASRNFVIDNFDRPTGTSSRGTINISSGLTQYEHGQASMSQDSAQRAAAIQWNKSGGFFQLNAAEGSFGIDVSYFKALEFRLMLRCFGSLCVNPPDPSGDLDFSIALVDMDSRLSNPITLKSRAVVQRPGGSYNPDWNYQPFNIELFQTVRIPLSAFAGINLADFRGVRFVFDRTEASSIFLGNVRLTETPASRRVQTAAEAMRTPADSIGGGQSQSQSSEEPEVNKIVAIRAVKATSGLSSIKTGSGQTVEIEVTSTRSFSVADALPEMRIGEQTFTLSRYPTGATDRLVFSLESSRFNQIEDGTPVMVRTGGRRPWKFGPLQKDMAR